jgi:hypothetical protein
MTHSVTSFGTLALLAKFHSSILKSAVPVTYTIGAND